MKLLFFYGPLLVKKKDGMYGVIERELQRKQLVPKDFQGCTLCLPGIENRNLGWRVIMWHAGDAGAIF